ncbi:Poly-beta-1,6-N-acetyl-D-glucosamine synthase [Caulifigura coniformis]|uniref:Poly-beta-1,6-N-acetyl-D-glucosamine synthase n=1 Tax=Caulifigura coniformis TaxID=2527983 RepID=A0A517SA03_9PLAN|nr:glycosyltransferase family 2 protein [Caulifigura coniformis]QDT52959.1 Poly-beta-1,6-N-acetyl-D-glucosamine synthase [Caulifigura coniformis]
MTVVEIVFWASVVLLAYIYAGYPLLVWMLARFRGRPVSRGAFEGTISVILVAYNEAGRMTARLANVLASTAEPQVLEILIGSDGSTDATAAISSAYPDSRVCGFEFTDRRGKPSVINDLVAHARGDILLFLDARQDLGPDAVARLLENFADPAVGVVSGELVFRRDTASGTAAEGVGFYWTYEKMIRTAEARYRSVPGATGAFYAMRRELFRPIPAQTILDDVVIPMQAVERGYRCLLERGAEAYDRPSVSSSKESVRKRRTIAGCAQLIVAQPRWLLPWRNPIWWEFCSHKLLRLASPVLLLAAGISNLWLMSLPLYSVMLSLQFALYVSAFAGWMSQHLGKRSSLFGPSLMFVSLNATTLAALWDALLGRFHATWRKTA